MNYADAEAMLRGRPSKKIANNTYLKRRWDNEIGLLYHNTFIIVFKPESCKLFNGGWDTRSTKDRLNTFSPVTIVQRNFDWYVLDEHWMGVTRTLYIPFHEGIEVDYNGNVLDIQVSKVASMVFDTQLAQLEKNLHRLSRKGGENYG